MTVVRSRVGDVQVLTLRGEPDDELLRELCALLDATAGEAVAVDLSEITMSSPDVVRDIVTLVAETCEAARTCIVSRRPSARVVLRRVGRCPIPLFPTVADAVQQWAVDEQDRAVEQPRG